MTSKAGSAASIEVEIVYADAQRAVVKSLRLPFGARVAQAVSLAAEDEAFRDLNLHNAAVGIFGQIAQRDQVLSDGDRIEIYRPLSEDPKTARRKRAARSRSS